MGFGPLFVAVPLTLLAVLRRDMAEDGASRDGSGPPDRP